MIPPVGEMKAPYTCDLKALFALPLLKWFSSENARAMLLWVMWNKQWFLYRNTACQTVEQGKERLSRPVKSQVRVTVQSRHSLFMTGSTLWLLLPSSLEATHDYSKEKSASCLRHNRADSSKKIFDRQWSFLESLKVIISRRKKNRIL